MKNKIYSWTTITRSISIIGVFSLPIFSAEATQIETQFQIELTFVPTPLASLASTGDILSGSFIYDDATSGIYTPSTSQFQSGMADYANAISSVTLDINGFLVTGNSGDISFRDSSNPAFTGDDAYGIDATVTSELIGLFKADAFFFSGSGPSTTFDLTLDSDPLDTLPPSALPQNFGVSILFRQNGSLQFQEALAGSVVSLTTQVATIPVPAALWLFASGLLGILDINRRRAG